MLYLFGEGCFVKFSFLLFCGICLFVSKGVKRKKLRKRETGKEKENLRICDAGVSWCVKMKGWKEYFLRTKRVKNERWQVCYFSESGDRVVKLKISTEIVGWVFKWIWQVYDKVALYFRASPERFDACFFISFFFSFWSVLALSRLCVFNFFCFPELRQGNVHFGIVHAWPAEKEEWQTEAMT